MRRASVYFEYHVLSRHRRFGHRAPGGSGGSERDNAWSAEVKVVQPVANHNVSRSVGPCPSEESLVHSWN